MQDNTLKVTIDRPVSEVFQFTTDPHHTPEWVTSIAVEKVIGDWPPQPEKTIYTNSDHSNHWSEYVVTNYIKDKEFELRKKDGSYYVNYKYSSPSHDQTELTYYEWATNGKQLDDPFTQDILNHLKEVMESRPMSSLKMN